MNGKPAAIMGASTGKTGTAWAQQQIRLLCVANNILALVQPQVLVPAAKEKFDANGKLVDKKRGFTFAVSWKPCPSGPFRLHYGRLMLENEAMSATKKSSAGG